jgi:phosphate transport system substrate-binding protein
MAVVSMEVKEMLRGISGRLLLFFTLNVIIMSPAIALTAEVIKIGGTGAALGPMKQLAAAFEKSNPGIKVVVLPSMGSRGAVKAIAQKAIDIGILGRPLNDDEAGRGESAVQFAKTPFIVIANKDVGVDDISMKDIVKIYRGDMLRWPDGNRIRIPLRPDFDASTLILRKISPEMSAAVDMARSRLGTLKADTDQNNASVIQETSGAVGFSALSLVLSEKRKVKILRLDGVAPSLNNLSNGTYPLFVPLFTVTKKEASEGVRKFLNFLRSGEGKRILAQNGCLSITK